MSKFNVISGMNIEQPYTSIVINAVGVASKFASYVKDTEVKLLREKYDKYLQLREDYSKTELERKTEENECKKNGKKFDKRDYYKLKLKSIEKEEKKLCMSKSDLIKAENLSKVKVEKNKNYLDEWQKEAIKVILKGESVSIFGPTSGGKTYLVKYIINELKCNKSIVYVSPTFHLALQTYADIQMTYSGFPASLITDKLIDYNKDCNIYVGTSEELLNFLIGNNIKVDVGIFDEIHSISTNVFNDFSRINATTELLKLCKDQIITLSATINSEDKPKLIDYINSITHKVLKEISYNTRVVPQEFYTFDNKSLKKYTKNESEESILSPENILKLCLKMRDKDMLPSLFFILINTFDKFKEFIKFIDLEESREYYRLHQLANDVNTLIDDYNNEYEDYKESLNGKDIDGIEERKEGKLSDLKKVEGSLKSKRDNLIITIKNKLEIIIHKLIILIDDIQNYEREEQDIKLDEPKYFKKNTNWIKYIPFKVFNNEELVDLKTIIPTPELVELCEIYGLYCNLSFEETLNLLPSIPETRGSYFNFGNSYDHILTSFNNKQTKQGMKIKNLILSMALAEGLEEKDISKFINVIANGLSFGISALLKEFPFFIQYQIMELMKTKKLGVVFSNESMSMGINYPLRSVIIASTLNETHHITNLLQMAGRCGRRGLDTVSYVITWGIKNTDDIITQKIENLSLSDNLYELNKPENICEYIKSSNDKNTLQNIYLRYYSSFSKEETSNLITKYKLLCENEYKHNYC